MNYKIIYSGENSLLGIREGYSFRQIDKGDISESYGVIDVLRAGGLKNVYFVQEDSLVSGPKEILAEDNDNRGVIEEDFYFYRHGFEYRLFQISTRTDYQLGSYCSYGVFYKDTAKGVKISYWNQDNEVIELPFIAIDVKEAADRNEYLFIALTDGSFKVANCEYCEEDEDNCFDDEQCPYLNEVDSPALIVEQENRVTTYVYDASRKVYVLDFEGDVLHHYLNAFVTGSESFATLYGYKENGKEVIAQGRIDSMDDYGIVIGRKKFNCPSGCVLSFEPVKEVEAVKENLNIHIVHPKAEAVQEVAKPEPKEEKVTYFSPQPQTEINTEAKPSKSFGDYVLPWRWFN